MPGTTRSEVFKLADASARILTLTADVTLTSRIHANRILLLGEVGGNASLTATLPSAKGAGDYYHFIVSVVNTSNYVIVVANANDTIDGVVVNVDTDSVDNSATGFASAAASDTMTFNGTTQGMARIGDWIRVTDILVNQWTVTAILTGSGTVETPFTAAV